MSANMIPTPAQAAVTDAQPPKSNEPRLTDYFKDILMPSIHGGGLRPGKRLEAVFNFNKEIGRYLSDHDYEVDDPTEKLPRIFIFAPPLTTAGEALVTAGRRCRLATLCTWLPH